MWPFSAGNVLDQQVAQALPQGGFGALSGPSQLQQPAQPQQTNRILQNPQLMQALGRMGASINQANARGAGFGGSLSAGFDGFNASVEDQRQQAEEKRFRDAQIGAYRARAAADEKDAQYGVQSGGFEGDIARAQAVLNDPMSREQDKSIARAVIQTAERMQGSYDPVTGDYRLNPRARIGGADISPQPLPSNPAAAPETVQSDMLLPPPSAGSPQDASLFSTAGTGNRKVDAALTQKSRELELQTQAEQEKAQREKQSELPKVVDQGNYMLSIIDQALASKGLEESVGGPAGITGRIAENLPLTQGQRDFAPLAQQLRGNAFLQAYQTLKGGGAIANAEGQKAEAAIARLQQYQSVDSYKAALKELREVVQNGMDRAKGGVSMSAEEQADSAMRPVKPVAERLRFNPQTGAFE